MLRLRRPWKRGVILWAAALAVAGGLNSLFVGPFAPASPRSATDSLILHVLILLGLCAVAGYAGYRFVNVGLTILFAVCVGLGDASLGFAPLAIATIIPTISARFVAETLIGRIVDVKARHLCSECLYDLHGLTSNRCPECGTAFRADNAA